MLFRSPQKGTMQKLLELNSAFKNQERTLAVYQSLAQITDIRRHSLAHFNVVLHHPLRGGGSVTQMSPNHRQKVFHFGSLILQR